MTTTKPAEAPATVVAPPNGAAPDPMAAALNSADVQEAMVSFVEALRAEASTPPPPPRPTPACFQKDGTIQLDLIDTVATLRCCRVGEYGLFLKLLGELADEQAPTVEGVSRIDQQMAGLEFNQDLRLRWITKVVEVLGDSALPARDKLPTWLLMDASLPNEMLKHWRTVPLVSGRNLQRAVQRPTL